MLDNFINLYVVHSEANKKHILYKSNISSYNRNINIIEKCCGNILSTSDENLLFESTAI